MNPKTSAAPPRPVSSSDLCDELNLFTCIQTINIVLASFGLAVTAITTWICNTPTGPGLRIALIFSACLLGALLLFCFAFFVVLAYDLAGYKFPRWQVKALQFALSFTAAWFPFACLICAVCMILFPVFGL